MAGNGSAVYYSSDSHQYPTSWIKCNGASNSGFVFSNSSNVHIYNLKLESCSGQYTLKEKYKNAGALVFIVVENVTLDEIVVSNAMGYGLHTFNVFGANEILNSAFLQIIVLRTRKRGHLGSLGNKCFFASISFLDQLSVRNQKFITFEAILKGQIYLNAHITQVAQISRKYIHCNSK